MLENMEKEINILGITIVILFIYFITKKKK